MRWSREHPLQLTLLASAVSAAAVLAIAAVWGLSGFAHVWTAVQPAWLALAAGAELLTTPAYVLAYRAVAAVEGGPRLRLPLVIRVVAAGFGPFALGGGFALDKRALHAIEDDSRSATVRVLGLGALEWAILAPVAWVAAVVLLVEGDRRPMSSLLWPWAIAVPVGFALGLWLAHPVRRGRIGRKRARWRHTVSVALRGVGLLYALIRDPRRGLPAWAGAGLYWALDIASFYGALRFAGLRADLGEVILGYATGYALTRRSMPLGGAGVTEVLMTFALHWVGQPVLRSLAAVVVYRVFNFLLPTIPALGVRGRVVPLVEAADAGETPAQQQRRDAAQPLGA